MFYCGSLFNVQVVEVFRTLHMMCPPYSSNCSRLFGGWKDFGKIGQIAGLPMIKTRAKESKGGKSAYSSGSPRCNDSHEPKRLQQPEIRRSAWVTIQPWLHHVPVASTTWPPLPWVAIPHRVLSETPPPRAEFGGPTTGPTRSLSAAAHRSWALLHCWGTE